MMFAHPEPKEPPGGTPEEALLEVLGGVKEALDRMDGRAKDWGSQLVGLEVKIADASSRLDGFQVSFLERLQVAQVAQQVAETRAAEAASRHSIPTVDEAKLMVANCAECAERLGLLIDDGAAARGWSYPGPEAAAEATAEAALEEELRLAWLVMAPGGGHHGFRWDAERSLYCLLVGDEGVADEWRKKKGIDVKELAGAVLDEYEAAHPPNPPKS